jgi:hypothetical protein
VLVILSGLVVAFGNFQHADAESSGVFPGRYPVAQGSAWEDFLEAAPWFAIFGLALAGVMLVGDALRDRMDPRMRKFESATGLRIDMVMRIIPLH